MMQNNKLLNHIINSWPLEFDGQLSFTIALSGGIDSIVLLDLFYKIRQIKPINLSAIHVNHNLSINSEYWANFCQEICNNYTIPLKIESVIINKIGGEGLENNARIARYNAFYNCPDDIIVLAHHKNDQIETMLSQIMRGSSINNCAGMLSLSNKKNKQFWRPLLDISKEEIQHYSITNNLLNIEDESNQDNQYLRNFIRNLIMPQLENFDKNITTKLSKLVKQFQDAAQLNSDLAEIDLAKCSLNNNTLLKAKFLLLPSYRQLNLLNHLIKINNLPLSSQKSLHEFCRQLTTKQNPLIQIKLTQNHHLIADKINLKLV